MKAICASENFDLFMVLPVQRPESVMPLNWNFPAKIGPAIREQVTVGMKSMFRSPRDKFFRLLGAAQN
jgi:hypothetical protein